MFSFFKRKNNKSWQELLPKAEDSFSNNLYNYAIEFAAKAVKLMEEDDRATPNDMAYALHLWGKSAYILKQFEEAEPVLLRAGSLYQEIEDENAPKSLAVIWMDLAKMYYQQKNLSQSLAKLIQAKELILQEEATVETYHLELFLSLGDVYEKLKKYDHAVNYYEKYLDLLASVVGKEETNYYTVKGHKDKLKAFLQAQEAGFPEPFISVKYDKGGSEVFDSQYAAYFISSLPDPSQASLDTVFEGLSSFQLIKKTFQEQENSDSLLRVEELVHEENDPSKIKTLHEKMKLMPDQDFGHMMSNGDFILKLYKPETEPIELEILSANYIRWRAGWKEDAELEDANYLKQWLAELGASFD